MRRPRFSTIGSRIRAQHGFGWLLLATFGVGCAATASGKLAPGSFGSTANVTVGMHGGGSGRLGDARLASKACAGEDLRPETKHLSIADVRQRLTQKGQRYRVTQERDDLHLIDVETASGKVQLRVATLRTARDAGRHLHLALLEHGEGYWGVHRSNLAILGAPGATSQAIGFALQSGLGCWGVFTAAGRDDTFVVPGGYFEF